METELRIEGMTCGHCVKHVDRALRALAGVEDVAIELEAGRARVRHDDRCTVAALRAAVSEAGYAATPPR